MGLKFGTLDINAIKVGTSSVLKIYQGSNLIYPVGDTTPPSVPTGLTTDDNIPNFLSWSLSTDNVTPQNEIKYYIERADKNKAKIKYIFETHFHADFVSGHVTLAEKTGAAIVFGPSAKTNFEAIIAEDDQASLDFLKTILVKSSKEILIAKTGKEAVRLSLENPDLDLILMDINMPIMGGNDATKAIRGFDTLTPIIALTAADIEQYLIKGMWYFDKRLGELKYRLLGIAPVAPDVNFIDDDNVDPEENKVPLFWVWYPAARDILHNAKVFNQRNPSNPISFDMLLNARRFNSMIYREDNEFGDRDIKDYIVKNALFQLLESNRIKEAIRDKEQDMWSY